MKIITKKPGKQEEFGLIESVNQIYEMISDPEFVTFKDEDNIGMYVDDRGAYSGLKRNFLFSGSIIYGIAIFVGLDKQGRAKDLNVKQRNIISNYMKRFSLDN